jgi:transposase
MMQKILGRRRMLTKGVVLLHDKARSHTAARAKALIKLFNWEIFDHPPYIPELAPIY